MFVNKQPRRQPKGSGGKEGNRLCQAIVRLATSQKQ